MTSYRLIPLDDAVVFPGMQVTLSIDSGTDRQVLLVPRRGDEFAKVGVIAEVTERVKRGGRGSAVSLMGLHRALPGAATSDRDGSHSL
jgi:ATP-dependent Lon protease